MNKKQTKKQMIFSTTKNTRGSDEMIKPFNKNAFKNKRLYNSFTVAKQLNRGTRELSCLATVKEAAERSRL